MILERASAFYKVVILGDTGVGKTSLLNRYIHNRFSSGEYRATIGADFLTKVQNLSVKDKDVTLQIWDTAGQERFVSICLPFYRGSDCCVLVYDVNDPKSVDSLETWINHFNQEVDIIENNITVAIIGNKCDEKTVDSVENIEHAKEWCQKSKFMHFESSALDGSNIDIIFQSISDSLYEKNPKIIDFYDEESSLVSTTNMVKPVRPEKKGGCCG